MPRTVSNTLHEETYSFFITIWRVIIAISIWQMKKLRHRWICQVICPSLLAQVNKIWSQDSKWGNLIPGPVLLTSFSAVTLVWVTIWMANSYLSWHHFPLKLLLSFPFIAEFLRFLKQHDYTSPISLLPLLLESPPMKHLPHQSMKIVSAKKPVAFVFTDPMGILSSHLPWGVNS